MCATQGIYVPEQERVKIPVAIKEISDSSSPNTSNELLDEARVMASVRHPCCIRIVAVCLSKKMMLLTPLMPLGSLVDYLRRHKLNIGSHFLLTWSQQIAEVSGSTCSIDGGGG
jgi:epidermal growth factor receptor